MSSSAPKLSFMVAEDQVDRAGLVFQPEPSKSCGVGEVIGAGAHRWEPAHVGALIRFPVIGRRRTRARVLGSRLSLVHHHRTDVGGHRSHDDLAVAVGVQINRCGAGVGVLDGTSGGWAVVGGVVSCSSPCWGPVTRASSGGMGSPM